MIKEIYNKIKELYKIEQKVDRQINKVNERVFISFLTFSSISILMPFYFKNPIYIALCVIGFFGYVAFTFAHNKITGYYEKKENKDFFQKEIINLLSNEETKREIILYFSEQYKNQLISLSEMNELRYHLANNDYSKTMSNIYHMINKIEQNNTRKKLIEEAEKQLGLENITSSSLLVEKRSNLEKFFKNI